MGASTALETPAQEYCSYGCCRLWSPLAQRSLNQIAVVNGSRGVPGQGWQSRRTGPAASPCYARDSRPYGSHHTPRGAEHGMRFCSSGQFSTMSPEFISIASSCPSCKTCEEIASRGYNVESLLTRLQFLCHVIRAPEDDHDLVLQFHVTRFKGVPSNLLRTMLVLLWRHRSCGVED